MMKNLFAAILLALFVAVASLGPALAFGHTATPAGQCAQSEQAVDNQRAEENNPFSDTDPIPAKSGGFAKDGPAKPNCNS